jgi:hypothetical protein
MAKKLDPQLVLNNEADILEALRRNPKLIEFVENATGEMDTMAVGGNGRVIGLIPKERQTDELKMLAIHRHRHAIKEIDNPTQEMLTAALLRDDKKPKEKVTKSSDKKVKTEVEA